MTRWVWIDRLANVAIVVLALLVGLVAWRRYLFQHPPDVSIPAGSVIELKSVDWPANGFTVVLALSTECHFCSENAPLYRDIADRLRQNRIGRTVAVLPQSLPQSREYLGAMRVVPDSVLQQVPSFAKATPTIAAVGPNGRVLRAWVGRLSVRDSAAALREIELLAAQGVRACQSCGTS